MPAIATLEARALIPALPGRPQVVRVVAAEGPTMLAVASGTTTRTIELAQQGSSVDLDVPGLVDAGLSIEASAKILVTQTLLEVPVTTVTRPLLDRRTTLDVPAAEHRLAIVTARADDTVTAGDSVLLVGPEPIAASGYATWILSLKEGRTVIETIHPASVSVLVLGVSAGDQVLPGHWY